MDGEQTIAEIELLERIFAVPDTRPLSARDLAAANRRHDEKQPAALGSGSGSGMGSAAEPSRQSSDWARLKASAYTNSMPPCEPGQTELHLIAVFCKEAQYGSNDFYARPQIQTRQETNHSRRDARPRTIQRSSYPWSIEHPA
jgi:hypothetical protein